jgi:hypothetical protein
MYIQICQYISKHTRMYAAEFRKSRLEKEPWSSAIFFFFFWPESSYNSVDESRSFCRICARVGERTSWQHPNAISWYTQQMQAFSSGRTSPMYYDIYYVCIPHETLRVDSLFCWSLDSSISLLFLLPWTVLVKVMTSGTRFPILRREQGRRITATRDFIGNWAAESGWLKKTIFPYSN